MDSWSVIVDLSLLLCGALVLGALFERLRQSAIVGYIIAGMLLGPNALQWLSGSTEVELLAELGVALLLFAIGLEFSWRRLRRFGRVSLAGGTLQVVATVALGAGCAAVFGLSGRSAIVIGAILALSSTACVLRVLEGRSEFESVHGRYSLGVLLVQDLAVIPCVLLVTVLSQDQDAGAMALSLGKTLVFGALAVVVLYVLFTYIVPRVLRLGSVHRNRELSVLTAIVSGLGAVLLAHKAGLSPALGAFIAGMLLGESPFATQVRADISGIRTLFVTVFFSSIGALGDPAWMLSHWQILSVAVVVIIVGKSLITWSALRFFGAGSVSALATGICLGQIGEFSFIIAEIARGTLLTHELFLLLMSATILTMLLTPYLVAGAPKVAGYLVGSHGRSSAAGKGDDTTGKTRVLVVGFGPAGHVVGDQVREEGAEAIVLDLNPEIVASARNLGFKAILGDGQYEDVLLHAGVREAKAVVVTVPAPAVAIEVVRLVRSIAPDTVVVARSRFNRYCNELADAGAHVVHDEETHVGIRMSKSVHDLLAPDDPAPEAEHRDQP